MNSISISKLKENPSKAITMASEQPIAVENRSKVRAYLVGKDLYEKFVEFIEDYIDEKAVEEDDTSKAYDFEKVAKELGI